MFALLKIVFTLFLQYYFVTLVSIVFRRIEMVSVTLLSILLMGEIDSEVGL